MKSSGKVCHLPSGPDRRGGDNIWLYRFKGSKQRDGSKDFSPATDICGDNVMEHRMEAFILQFTLKNLENNNKTGMYFKNYICRIKPFKLVSNQSCLHVVNNNRFQIYINKPLD